jgi:O-antigen ligase
MNPLQATLPAAAVPSSGFRAVMERLALLLTIAGAFCPAIDWYVILPGVGDRFPLCDVFFLAAMLCAAPWALQGVARLGGVSLMPLAGAFLFLLSGMICFALAQPYAEPVIAAKLVFSLLLFPWLLVLVVHDARWKLDAVLAAWLAGVTLSALVAVASRNGVSILGLMDTHPGSRAYGLSYHPNVLGYAAALTAPVALYFVMRYRQWHARLLALISLALVLTSIQLSGSRAAVLALASGVALASLGLIRMRHWPVYLLVALGLTGIAMAVLVVLMETGLPVMDGIEDSAIGRILGLSASAGTSTSGRLLLMQTSWTAFLERPWFGNGYGHLRWAHLHFLAVLHAGGLLGLLAFLVWMTGIATASWRVGAHLQNDLDDRDRMLWPIVFTGLVVWFVTNALQPLITDRNGYILVGVLFLLDARLRRGRPSESVTMPASR